MQKLHCTTTLREQSTCGFASHDAISIYLFAPSNGKVSTQSILNLGSTSSDPLAVLPPPTLKLPPPLALLDPKPNSPGLISSGGPNELLPGPKPSKSSLSPKKNARFRFRNTGILRYRSDFRMRSLLSTFVDDLPRMEAAPPPPTDARRNCTVVSSGVK